jgi:uncharacterized protein YkuJ
MRTFQLRVYLIRSKGAFDFDKADIVSVESTLFLSFTTSPLH